MSLDGVGASGRLHRDAFRERSLSYAPSLLSRSSQLADPDWSESEPSPTASPLLVRRIDPTSWPAADWDALVVASGGSMLSASAHLRTLNLRMAMRGRVMTLGLYDGANLAGWCTLVVNSRRTRFYDGLRLLPGYEACWPEAMRAVIADVGPGRYAYGWALSLEPCRRDQLSKLERVRVLSTQDIVVQAVDFEQWASWQAYERDVSENTRRNAKKAVKQHPDLRIDQLQGLRTLEGVPALLRLRSRMYSRKGLPFRSARNLAAYLGAALLCPEQAMVALVRAGSKILATFHGVDFENISYYLDGASDPAASGAAWLLLLEMARRAYERAPKGKFILGFVRYPLRGPLPEGLMRSRQALRPTEFKTSTLEFLVASKHRS